MKKALLTATCVATLGVATAMVQGQQQRPDPGQQQTRPGQQAQPAPLPGQPVTLTGCVYQASDEPALFALRQTDHGRSGEASSDRGSAATQTGSGEPGATGQQGAVGQAGAGATDPPGATASTGRGAERAAGTTGTASGPDAVGAWYRLTPSGAENLEHYDGQRVAVSGYLVPGRDEQGADVIIHRIEPERTTVTAIQLRPAPQLEIGSISPVAGTCEMEQDRTGPQSQSQPSR